MADIKIHDIKLDGSDFFANDEGFMKDLAEDELDIIGAGKKQFTTATTIITITITTTIISVL
jgi:hypothetical protein